MFLNALANKNRSRPPVWLMRQAGRYMPSYQKLRAKHSLFDLFFTPELAAEITLLPVNELGVDVAILFSDITVVALALGYDLDFKEGPVIQKSERPKGIDALFPIYETIQILKKELKVPLIGFCGGPYTVASYMGKDPKLLEPIQNITIEYIKLQKKAGVDAIQIFDSWANQMSEQEFDIYQKKYLKPIVDATSLPVIFFMREALKRLNSILDLKPQAISFDSETPLSSIRKKTSVVLQGNLDPDLLFEPLDLIEKQTKNLLESMRDDPGFIANLGHGVKPETPYAAVQCFVETVKSFAYAN